MVIGKYIKEIPKGEKIMRFMKSLLLMLMVTCLFAVTTPASAMTFSADIYNSDGQNGKFYMDTDKIRTETREMISIVRWDKKLVWLLMPEEKQYMEQVLNHANINQKHMPSIEPASDEIERFFILHETINGYASDKYKVTVGKQSSYYEWISSDPGITMSVKTAAIDGSWWNEYRNISLDTPNPALFEIPSDYIKMSMPGIGGFMP
jgi:hypothetical protein